jgi:hypothetical protein
LEWIILFDLLQFSFHSAFSNTPSFSRQQSRGGKNRSLAKGRKQNDAFSWGLDNDCLGVDNIFNING